ncbi:hypothetical protein SDJN03_12349, partial [Cucurbita argyrosperma subsp. sororia]
MTCLENDQVIVYFFPREIENCTADNTTHPKYGLMLVLVKRLMHYPTAPPPLTIIIRMIAHASASQETYALPNCASTAYYNN